MSLPLPDEVEALVRIRPAFAWFAHDFVPVPCYGLVCPVLSSRARACRRNHQVPRAALPDVGVTFIRETCIVSCKDITPRSSLLPTHSPNPLGSPLLWLFPSFQESLQVATSPCCPRVLPQCPRPSQKGDLVGFSLLSANAIFRGLVIEVAAISLCSGLTVCLPPRSFLPLQVETHRAAEAFLCPSRTCVVTFARIGYAIRPTTGNWRNEDSHLARFAALSAAHPSSKPPRYVSS